jgi:hypothetical protein
VTPPAAVRTEILGSEGRNTLTLNHLAHALVDGGDGKDRITLGADHSDVAVCMVAGEVQGDVLKGFDPAAGDLLQFVGFSDEATVQSLHGDFFRVGSYVEGWERFTAAGQDNLAATDYACA